MVTAIIPALNEGKTIRRVVHLANNSMQVTEVIVVDDKSMDNTVEEARKEGAIVITSTKLAKGASMKDGVLVLKNEIIAFIDAGITTYPQDVTELLTAPIIEGKLECNLFPGGSKKNVTTSTQLYAYFIFKLVK